MHIHLISIEFMIWGTAIMVMAQLTRGLMDHRRGMNLLYGLTHAPANVLVCSFSSTLLVVHWVEQSLGKGECTSLQMNRCRCSQLSSGSWDMISTYDDYLKEPPAPNTTE